jgi:hypothetical protein
VKNPQYPSFSPTGITITEFRIYPSGAFEPSWTCIPQADGPVFYDLAAKVRCEDPTTHVGATLVAR